MSLPLASTLAVTSCFSAGSLSADAATALGSAVSRYRTELSWVAAGVLLVFGLLLLKRFHRDLLER